MTPIRRAPIALAAAGLLLAGCSSTIEGTASPSPTTGSSSGSSSSASSGSSSSSSPGGAGDVDDLSAGLLPEDAFGPGATAAPISVDDVAAGSALGEELEGATITPESCAPALQKGQPSVEDLSGFAGQTVTTGSTITGELITAGVPGDPIADVSAAIATCPQITVSSPDIGTATVTLAPLSLPDLGDGSVGMSYTTTVTGPDGSQLAIPALYAFVADGDRIVTVLTSSISGSPDVAAFTALVQQAYEYQADQLD